jgi:hypothetical protein
MADKNNSGVRFDDFIAKVHADPANVEPKTLLSGYIGRGDGDGKIRIYSDQSLSHWVEAAADDVVHSQPIEGSALGGSHIWLKGDAELKPGSAAGATPAAQAAPAGGIGADTGVFNPYTTIHPTLLTQVGCGSIAPPCMTWPTLPTAATLCTHAPPCPTHFVICHSQIFPCGPLTVAAPCPTHDIRCQPTVHLPCQNTTATLCTQAPVCHTHEFICPRPTLICPPVTQHNCPTHSTICVASGGFACPPPQTINENPAVHPQAQMMAAPGTIGCGNTLHGCPPTNMPGCGPHTFVPNCAPTQMLGCGPHTMVPNCAPTQMLGCGNTLHGCPPTHMLGCPPTSTCPPTQNVLGCGNTLHGCPPTHMPGCGPHTMVPNCAPTYLLGCGPHTYVPNCAPTHLVGCPGTSTCGVGQVTAVCTHTTGCISPTIPGAAC